MSSRPSDYRRNGGGYRDRSRSPDRNRGRDRDGDRYSSRNGRDYRDGRDSRDARDSRDFRDGRDGRDGRDNRDSYRDSRYFREERDRERSPISSSKSEVDKNGAMDVDKNDAPPARKVPISLEELIKQKEQEKQALEKPKFLSKEERAKLALERRAKEVEAQRAAQELERQQRAEFDAKARTEVHDYNRYSYDSRDSKINARERDRSGRVNGDWRKDSADTTSSASGIVLAEKEIDLVKKKYMGIEEKERKIRKRNDKKFVFDWNADDDTSRDLNPLYTHKHSAQLYGRGHFAGIELKDHKGRDQFYDKLVASRRTDAEVARAGELGDIAAQKERKINYADRHWSDKPLDQMRDRDWRIFKEDFNIACKGGSIPNPIRRWSESNIDPKILEVIDKVGYKEPTPIQRQAIPIGLQNRDIIGIAETGSGKTASFLIPMLQFIFDLPKLNEQNMVHGPYALIMAPTRELAQQIEQETLKFAIPLGFNCVSIVGGHAVEEQAFNLRNGAEIIIATPGRLKDCLDRRILVLNQCTYVVMDEADRMIDMGFEADVNFILDALPVSNLKPDTDEAEDATKMTMAIDEDSNKKYRQTTMFSATMPAAVERLAKRYLRRPAVVTIGTAGQAVETVEQRVEMITDENKKKNRLMDLLRGQFAPPMIVFVNQKKSCDMLAKMINSSGLRATTLHGGKSQEQRELALSQLKSGKSDVLVATDVAGRGIDVQNVSLVVNFDMAKSIEDYTHRIGRTGRAGRSGVAVTFLSSYDTDVYYDLKQMLTKSTLATVPAELRNHEAAMTKGGVGSRRRGNDEF
ncbi:DEAD (Asp-Glu-Ala-Asp) box polypeptide 23 [Entomortierella chlamydospora]|uniref:RNA helicase n=1 Tax=Entomortierella chlamydospora TaxID=101097 RepID=A0A9P6N3V2_9FUNG|nr:DEAD (Asp-Glu-Ala-Asp) box polypeptide 23 [Entomortierella chlamydospora]KAG0024169.1 DEAD (Asp-Glu-Ala-Asp) box polypeptide 23 [Entomortierella chlamydospora]